MPIRHYYVFVLMNKYISCPSTKRSFNPAEMLPGLQVACIIVFAVMLMVL